MVNIVENLRDLLGRKGRVHRKKMKEGHLERPISVMMAEDVWVRRFMHECCLIFGMPCVAEECLTKTDRFKYAFSLMSVSTSMRRMAPTWKGMYKKMKPKEAAWEFNRRYFEKYGIMVIPSTSDDMDAASKVLPHLISKKGVQD
jgi:hypothetical protein